MGFGSGSWVGFIAVAALIALAAAGGEIILVPLAVIAALAAAAWYVLFHVLGADREREAAATADRGGQARSLAEIDLELLVNRLGAGELPGGAEGGDNSPSANRICLPSRDGTPWGDTDQHSSGAAARASGATARARPRPLGSRPGS